MGWICVTAIVLIICATILGALYLMYCGENEIGIFRQRDYDEKEINMLKLKIAKIEEKLKEK